MRKTTAATTSCHDETAAPLSQVVGKSFLCAIVLTLLLTSRASAATDTWAGGSSTDWAGLNWTGGNNPPGSGDSLAFGSANGQSTNTLTDTLANGFAITSITFNPGAVAYTMTGNSITLGTSTSATVLTNSGTNLETINNNIILGGTSNATTQTVSLGSGGGNITLGGAVSGPASLATTGTGTLTLNGVNTFAGNTTIGAGTTLTIGGAGALNSDGSNTYNHNMTINGTFDYASSVNQSLNLSASSISGVGALILDGPGGLTMGGLNSFSGNITINSGTMTAAISANSSNPTSTALGNMQNSGRTITINGGTLLISASNALGNGGSTILTPIVVNSGGLLEAAGTSSNNQLGPITLSGGTLTTSGSGFSSSFQSAVLTGSVTVTGANLTSTINTVGGTGNNGVMLGNSGAGSTPITFTVNATDTLNVSAVLAPHANSTTGGALTLAGAGTMFLSGSNTYTGGTTINGGTLKVGNATALGTGTVNVSGSGATLDLNGTTMTTTGALTLNGTGVSSGGALTNSSATAGTYAGLVALGSSGVSIGGTGAINLSNGGTITGSGDNLILQGAGGSISSIIGTGAGGLTVNTTGTWTLTGASTFTGNVAINGGAVVANLNSNSANPTSGALGNGQTASRTITVGSTGTLELASNNVLGTSGSTPVVSITVSQGGLLEAGTGTGVCNVLGPLTLNGGTVTTSAGFSNVFQSLVLGGNVTVGGTGPGVTSTINTTGGANNGVMLGSNTNFNITSTDTLNISAPLTYQQGGTTGGALTLSGGGTMFLSGANTYTGGTTISAGVLQVANATALGTGTVSVSGSGAALDLNATTMTSTGALTLNGTGISSGGALTNSSATAGTYAGLVALGSSGVSIGGTGKINLTNTGTITGSGDNLTLQGVGGSVASIIGTGAGTLTANTSGTWTLSGANTYTGGTTITAGTLEFTGTAVMPASGQVTVNNGAVLAVEVGSSPFFTDGAATNGTVEGLLAGLGGQAGGTVVFNSGSSLGIDTTPGNFQLNGTVTNSGLSLVKLGTNNLFLDPVGTSTYSGGVVITNGGVVLVQSSAAGTGTITLGNSSGSANASLFGGNNGITASNPINVVAGSTGTLTIGQINATVSTLSGAITLANNLTLGAPSGSTGLGVILTGGITGTGNLTFNSQNGTGYVTISTGSVNMVGSVSNISGFSNGTNTISSNIGSNVTTVTQNSATSPLVLSGSNAYTGGTTINSGLLVFAKTTSMPGTGAVTVNNGGILDVDVGSSGSLFTNGTSGNGSVGGLLSGLGGQAGGTVTFNSGATLGVDTTNAGGSFTYSGNIANPGGNLSFTKYGSGNLTLAGANSYTGKTTVSAGSLTISADNNLGAAPGSSTVGDLVLNGGTTLLTTASFTLNSNRGIAIGPTSGTGTVALDVTTGTLTYGGIIANNGGTGALSLTGPGTLVLSGANTYTGSTTLAGGVVNLGNAASLNTAASSGGITFTGGTMQYTAASAGTDYSSKIANSSSAISIDTNGQSVTFNGALASTNTGGLTKLGTGTLALNGSNSYTGATTVSGGMLAINSNASLGSSTSLLFNGGGLEASASSTLTPTTVTITGGDTATIQVDSTATLTVNAGINETSSSGALTKTGNGTLVFGGASGNSYTGLTTINAGIISYQNATSLGANSAIVVNSGGTAQIADGTDGGSDSITLSGVGATSSGATGALEYAGSSADSYSGPIILAANATIASDGGTFSLTGGISGNHTLTVVGPGNTTISSAITTGAGGLIFNGTSTGTLILSAQNTYTGATAINSGTVRATVASIAGTSGALGNNSAVTLASGAALDVVQNTQIGSLTGGGNVVLSNSKTLTIGGDGTSPAAFSGVISGGNSTSGVAKIGAGTLALSNANTYTGSTTIAGGNLQLTGSLASGSTVAVGNNTSTTAILSGTGTASGNVTTTTSGSNVAYLAPGVNTTGTRNDFGNAGTLHVGGNLSLGTGANLDFDLSSSHSSGNDQIVAGGTLTIGTALTFNFNQLSGSLDTTGAYQLITFNGTAPSLSGVTFTSSGTSSYTPVYSIDGGGKALDVAFSLPSATPTAAYFNGQGTDLGTYTNFDTDVSSGTAVSAALGNTTNVSFNANRDTTISTATLNTALDINSVTFGTGSGIHGGMTINGTGTMTIEATTANGNTIGNGIKVNSGGGNNAINTAVVLDNDQTWTVTDATSTLTVGGAVSGGHMLSTAGSGVINLTNATGNSYSGGTSVGGSSTLLLNNTSNSAAGTGSLTVNGGATLGGSGSYGTSGSPGAHFAITGTGTATGMRANVLVGMNSAADTSTSTTLSLIAATGTISNANLTFNLNANVAGGLGGTSNGGSAGGLGVANSGTELSVGNTRIAFGTGVASVTLTLNLQNESAIVPAYTPYVLIAGTLPSGGGGNSDSQYSGLTLGTVLVNSGGVTETIISGNNLALAFSGSINQQYYGANSYLVLYQNTNTGTDDIAVLVVPEPGTWAMMLGGLAMLLFWQRRRSKD